MEGKSKRKAVAVNSSRKFIFACSNWTERTNPYRSCRIHFWLQNAPVQFELRMQQSEMQPPQCFGKKLQTQPVKMLTLPVRLFFALSTRGNQGVFYLGLGNRLSTSSLKFWIGTKRFRKWTAPRQEPRLRRNSGGRNRIRTCEGKARRFTVSPRWPLGYPTLNLFTYYPYKYHSTCV